VSALPFLACVFLLHFYTLFFTHSREMVLTDVPSNSRFQHHVSFDNFAAAEPTKNNSISYCLNVKHTGYQYKRRSRTFMVGLDENDYSSIALQWVLEELVDDGDEIVCLRVIEKATKINNSSETKRFQKEANDLMDKIQTKNDVNRAISIVLEFAFGKVSQTFLQMLSLTRTHPELMLIIADSNLRTGHVDRWNSRTQSRRSTRARQPAKFILEMVPSILANPSCSSPPSRETD
jgi:hypothetical protein